MGATLDQLRGVCRADPEALDAIARATQNAPGRPPVNGVNHPNKQETPDRSGKHLRRLRKDFPDLHHQVVDGGKTVHAASLEAGIYPARASVPLSVEGFARAISKHLSAEQRVELAGRALR